MQGYQPLLEAFNDHGRMHSLTFYLWLQYIEDIELAVKYFTDCSKAVQILWIFFSVLCLLCLCALLFTSVLWSSAVKRLTTWLSFVVYYCESLSHWYPGSDVVLDCIDS